MSTYLPRLLITGGDGQVGSALKKAAATHSNQFIFCNREEADITSNLSLDKVLQTHMPDIVINTAAYTAVDKAESAVDESAQINVHGARTLAKACHKHQIPLIHLSTDYVFDGNRNEAYKEDDAINPVNIYGKSKWLGEKAIREACAEHIIVRVSGVFSEYRTNFLKTILRLAQERNHLRIVNDQFTCPTYAGDIAEMLIKIANNANHAGTYHFCSSNPVSWYEFAGEIINQTESSSVTLEPIPTSDYPTPAKRPAYSVLDCTKIKIDYAISQPDWKTGIRSALLGHVETLSSRA